MATTESVQGDDQALLNDASYQNTFAAIDLGSNSFHMVVAAADGDSIRIIDRLRAPVRLGAGLDKKKNINSTTQAMALDTLSQFAQRTRHLPRKNIRLVGTNTLRRARNADGFIREAFSLLGKRIEIISGREEARLIYASVAHTLAHADQRRLVIDIGGGSTELITGTGLKPHLMESFNMGCVSQTQDFFNNNRIDARSMKAATIVAQLELQPLVSAFVKSGWVDAIGCSGTIKAISKILEELGYTDGTITLSALKKLNRTLVRKRNVEALELTSISRDRMQVLPGGLAILTAIMKTLFIQELHVSQVALREGLIFDMLGRDAHISIQKQTLDTLVQRYLIDPQQAQYVETVCSKLFESAADNWKLDPENDWPPLQLSAQLHEIGMAVAHTQYHKHGAYLLENADLLGFTRAEQSNLALLVRYHRRKFDLDAYHQLPASEQDRLIKLTILLRLAVLLQRSRQADDLSPVSFKFKRDRIQIKAPASWFTAHPLTAADLDTEARHLEPTGIELVVTQKSKE